jgi:putative flippase GtrA
MSGVANVKQQFIRYVLVGGLAASVEYSSFYLLFSKAHMSLVLANGLSFCLGLGLAFALNRLWAFSSHEYDKKAAHQFSFYAALAVFNLLLTLALVGMFKHLGIDPLIGKLLAMATTSSWNFILLKLLVFTHVS